MTKKEAEKQAKKMKGYVRVGSAMVRKDECIKIDGHWMYVDVLSRQMFGDKMGKVIR